MLFPRTRFGGSRCENNFVGQSRMATKAALDLGGAMRKKPKEESYSIETGRQKRETNFIDILTSLIMSVGILLLLTQTK